jgi:1-acyl-sn-glycerol-3-phosphate acyltransferase
MLNKVGRVWRLFATALSFTLFGVGGIVIVVFVVPVFMLIPSTQIRKEARGQKLIHFAFASFIEIMRLLGILRYTIEGTEKLRSAQLVLANHPTLLDVVFLISLIPNANCVVKGALIRNPFMRGAIGLAGYTINDGAADEVLLSAKKVFDKQQIMIVFPEGTRSVPGKALNLKRGAANIAIRAGVDITPVTIICEPISLTKQHKWYHIPVRKMHFTITTNPIIKVHSFMAMGGTKGARALTDYLTTYFNAEVGVNDSVAK